MYDSRPVTQRPASAAEAEADQRQVAVTYGSRLLTQKHASAAPALATLLMTHP